MNRNTIAELAFTVGTELDDVEFVEFFAMLRKQMLSNIFGSVDPDELTKDDIYALLTPTDVSSILGDFDSFTDWLHHILAEVILEKEIEPSAWWKE